MVGPARGQRVGDRHGRRHVRPRPLRAPASRRRAAANARRGRHASRPRGRSAASRRAARERRASRRDAGARARRISRASRSTRAKSRAVARATRCSRWSRCAPRAPRGRCCGSWAPTRCSDCRRGTAGARSSASRISSSSGARASSSTARCRRRSSRSGTRASRAIAKPCARAPAGAIYRQDVTPQPISATAIRAALARGPDGAAELHGLLPAGVLSYIARNGLYGATSLPQDAT